jgi:multiple sugar transport system ATP-binding protein
MIAGLEEISGGEVLIGGRVVNAMMPKERDIAMVFQNYALYPHMTVRDNMAFSLMLAKQPKAVADERVRRAAEILGLGELLDRYPRQLSGGQRQRVAMGRAIVRDPKAFLMDEPLSNLDAKLRVQMRTEVARIQKQLGTTMVYVTHDQTEAMTLGDRVAVMRAGIIQQVDTPANLYENPQNLFVAGFIGSPSMNFLPGRLEGDVVKTPIGEVRLSDQVRSNLQREGDGSRDVIVGMRPEHFEDAAVEQEELPNRMKFRTKVDVVESMGAELYVYFDVESDQRMQTADLDELAADAGMEDLPSHGEGQQVVARLSADSKAAPGGEVELTVDTSEVKLFDAGNGRSLTAA